MDEQQILKPDTERLFFDWVNLLVAPWYPEMIAEAGELVRALPGTGFFYECSVAGQAHSRAPNWPRTANTTVVDGAITWTAKTLATASNVEIASCSYTISGGGLTSSAEDVDNARLQTSLLLDTSAARLGTYVIEATMTDTASAVHVQSVKIRVLE